jgi:two-component system, chemotaxis family, CheB/CheR fusion protein
MEQIAIVGIGASAGGLDALRRFLKAMPADSGLAIVIIQHLDPDHTSILGELLATHSRMPVQTISGGMQVRANHIFVIPPNTTLTIRGSRFELHRHEERRSIRTLIDSFFRSLAAERRQRAIGIVLSGMGSDGALGLKAIHVAGGMTMAQAPESAEFASMPQSAIRTGLVDHILPVEDMPAAIQAYVRNAYVHRSPEQQQTLHEQDFFTAILALLRGRTNHDFSLYKRSTLMRRIERRISISGLTGMAEYLEYLQKDKSALDVLFRDLLISVTIFFRDPAGFADLQRHVIKPIVAQTPEAQPIRVWVPGCATGEEAYSLAILFLEELIEARKSCPLQIFATDISEQSLALARAGVYPESIIADVSPQRLQRFFVHHSAAANYQINTQLRESVIFAEHNLISDPPFSRLALISCRNLLIYLGSEAQQRALRIFNFALQPGGYLFLGSAENPGDQGELFSPILLHSHIYHRTNRSTTTLKDLGTTIKPLRPVNNAAARNSSQPMTLNERFRRFLLNNYGPAAVLINNQFTILVNHGPLDKYLKFPAGEPSNNLITLLREGLRSTVRRTIVQAMNSHQRESSSDARVRQADHYVPVTVTVMQMPSTDGDELYCVVFSEQAQPSAQVLADDDPAGVLIRQLEQELHTVRMDLQSSIEDLERAGEEQRIAHEEVLSINEELQSTNEELETSKEEMQSLNEEQETINQQLQQKVIELEDANNDLANLLSSTEIATLFLDRNMQIKRFTPATNQLFHLLPTDIGRPISDVAPRFSDRYLISDIQHVATTLEPRWRDIYDFEGNRYIRRVLPYRLGDERMEGTVITFSDVTALRTAEQALAQSERRLFLALRNSPVTLFQQEGPELRYVWVYNPQVADILGKTDAESMGQSATEQLKLTAVKHRVMQQGRGEQITVTVTINGSKRVFETVIEPLRDEQQAVIGILGISIDVTERQQAEERERDMERMLQHAQRLESLGLLAGGIAHDFNNLLMGIAGHSDLLLDEMSPDNPYRPGVEQIELLTRRAGELVNQLVIYAGQGQMQSELLDLNHLLHEMEPLLASIVPKQQFISYSYAVGGAWLNADSAQMRQIIMNLVVNAAEASSRHDTLQVRIETEYLAMDRLRSISPDLAVGNYVVLEVEDQGSGISAGIRDRIFDPFFSTRGSGRGLGLAVVQGIVHRHMGAISLISEIGQGTRCRIYLPGALPPATGKHSSSEAAVPWQGSDRVLVVDDEEYVRSVALRMLNRLGLIAVPAGDGFEALEVLARSDEPFDVLLLDLTMPGLSGDEVLTQVRQNYPQLPIIVASGYSDQASKYQSLPDGRVYFLAKPFKLNELRGLLQHIFGAPGQVAG